MMRRLSSSLLHLDQPRGGKLFSTFGSSLRKAEAQMNFAEEERKRRLVAIYNPHFERLTDAEKLAKAKTGEVWWNAIRIDKNPRDKSSLEIARLLDEADRLSSKIALDRDDYWYDPKSPAWAAFRLALNHHSTAIEGNSLAKPEVKRVLEVVDEVTRYAGDTFDSELLGLSVDVPTEVTGVVESIVNCLPDLPPDDVVEVVHHDQALTFIKDHMLNKPLTESSILQVKSLVVPENSNSRLITVRGLDDDHQYRSRPVKVSGSSCVRPYPQELPAIMERLIEWHTEQKDIHPIVQAAVFKMNLLQVHPFSDGNGRVARLLLNCLLHNSGYYCCVISKRERQQYLIHFPAFQDEGKADGIVQFLSRRVVRHLQQLASYNPRI